MLRDFGWTVRVEVSFNHYGDRGRVDVLAYHPPSACLVVGEVKTALGDLQDTVGRLDVKTRLGRRLARDAGWPEVRAVIPALILVESGTTRRIVAAHPSLFAQFALRGRDARSWIRSPNLPAPAGLLWFANLPPAHRASTNAVRRVRIRHPRVP